jgi:DNA polymerase III epsilon subunit-like protein
MIHLSLDLELEQNKTNPQTPDSQLDEAAIIQVGLAVYDPEVGIIETRGYHINIGVPISGYIQKLTGITNEDLELGVSLDFAYEEMVRLQAHYKTSRALLQWGGGDDEALKKELGKDTSWMFGRSGFNVKHLYRAYAEANGLNISGGLKTCCKRLGLPFEGRAHDAVWDAAATAKVYGRIMRAMKRERT